MREAFKRELLYPLWVGNIKLNHRHLHVNRSHVL